jgi:raffinose/stachyose/melibiose transport system permease protein
MAVVAAPEVRNERLAPRKRRDWVGAGLWIALLISAFAWAVPFLFMFLTSVKSGTDIAQQDIWDRPTGWQWSNYAEAIETGDLWVTGFNSLLISTVKVPLGILLAAATAFALGRLRFRRHKLVLALFAVGSMVPIQIGRGPRAECRPAMMRCAR